MATFGALRPPWNRLLHPYRTHVLCPPNLCPDLCLKAKVAGLLSLRSGVFPVRPEVLSTTKSQAERTHSLRGLCSNPGADAPVGQRATAIPAN